MYYDGLLKLCGFEVEEIERERPRIEKTFEKLEIGGRDCERAESRVEEYFDIELLGMRKILGIWMKDLVDLVLSKDEGKKLCFYSFPTIAGLGAAVSMASDKVHSVAPEMVLDIVMGQIFDKLTPILETAEQHGMPPGLAMCSLNQARIGGVAKGIIPLADASLASSFFCDQEAKTDDLLHEVYGLNTIFIDNVMDSNWGEFPGCKPERIKYLGKELNDALDQVQKALEITVGEEAFKSSMTAMGRFWAAFNQLIEFNLKSDPLPLSQVDICVIRLLVSGSTRRLLTDYTEAMNILIPEVKRRADEGRGGKGVPEKGAPRVTSFLPVITDPGITRMVESVGLAIPVAWLCWFAPIEPYQTTYTTWGEQKAEFEMKIGIYHSTEAMVWRFKQICERLNMEGLFYAWPFS